MATSLSQMPAAKNDLSSPTASSGGSSVFSTVREKSLGPPLKTAGDDKVRGFTLIEVLVALAIVAIAMTAIIKATSQNIRSTSYLQQKTQALWVGQEVLTEVQLGLIKLADDAPDTKHKMTMLNTDWYWQAGREDTPNSRIKKISVQVFANEDEATPTIDLTGYTYHA